MTRWKRSSSNGRNESTSKLLRSLTSPIPNINRKKLRHYSTVTPHFKKNPPCSCNTITHGKQQVEDWNDDEDEHVDVDDKKTSALPKSRDAPNQTMWRCSSSRSFRYKLYTRSDKPKNY